MTVHEQYTDRKLQGYVWICDYCWLVSDNMTGWHDVPAGWQWRWSKEPREGAPLRPKPFDQYYLRRYHTSYQLCSLDHVEAFENEGKGEFIKLGMTMPYVFVEVDE